MEAFFWSLLWRLTTTPFWRMQSLCHVTGGHNQSSLAASAVLFLQGSLSKQHHMYFVFTCCMCFQIGSGVWVAVVGTEIRGRVPVFLREGTLRGSPYWLFQAWKDDIERPRFSFLNLRWQPHCPWLLNESFVSGQVEESRNGGVCVFLCVCVCVCDSRGLLYIPGIMVCLADDRSTALNS